MNKEEILETLKTLNELEKKASKRGANKMTALGFINDETNYSTITVDFNQKSIDVVLRVQLIGEVIERTQRGVQYDIWYATKSIVLTWDEFLMDDETFKIEMKDLANAKENWEITRKKALGL